MRESLGRTQQKFSTGYPGEGYYWAVAVSFPAPDSAARFVELVTSALQSQERSVCDQLLPPGAGTMVSASRRPVAEVNDGHNRAQRVTITADGRRFVYEIEEHVWASGSVVWQVFTTFPAATYDPEVVERFVSLVVAAAGEPLKD